MYEVSYVFYKFRHLLVGLLVVVCLLSVSALITTTGKNSTFNGRAPSKSSIVSSGTYDTPNTVTASVYTLAEGTDTMLLTFGTTLYRASSNITNVSSRAGKALLLGNSIAFRTMRSGATFAVQTLAAANSFIVRAPNKVIAPTVRVQGVGNIIRPADDVDVPVIDAKTSTEEISRLGEQQQQHIKELLAAQLAANKALAGTEVDGNLRHGGYPARWDNARQDSMLDTWGMYNRECVSYAAWKVNQTFGTMPYWGGIGNANQWVGNARAAGIPTGKTPQVHSVAISMAGYYGHAMWVEAVKGDMIYVSQYNYGLRGRYSEMWVNGRQFTYIYFR